MISLWFIWLVVVLPLCNAEDLCVSSIERIDNGCQTCLSYNKKFWCIGNTTCADSNSTLCSCLDVPPLIVSEPLAIVLRKSTDFITLECIVLTNHTDVNITWFKNNEMVLNNNGCQLNLTDIRRGGADGKYHCQATSSAGSSNSSIWDVVFPYDAPSSPAGLRYSVTALDSVTVSWAQVSPVVIEYQVTISNDSDVQTNSTAAFSPQIDYTGLDLATKAYRVNVRAKDVFGYGAPAEVIVQPPFLTTRFILHEPEKRFYDTTDTSNSRNAVIINCIPPIGIPSPSVHWEDTVNNVLNASTNRNLVISESSHKNSTIYSLLVSGLHGVDVKIFYCVASLNGEERRAATRVFSYGPVSDIRITPKIYHESSVAILTWENPQVQSEDSKTLLSYLVIYCVMSQHVSLSNCSTTQADSTNTSVELTKLVDRTEYHVLIRSLIDGVSLQPETIHRFLFHSSSDTCRPTDFVCASGKCLDRNKTCDGCDDCGDWSDERNSSAGCALPETPAITNVTASYHSILVRWQRTNECEYKVQHYRLSVIEEGATGAMAIIDDVVVPLAAGENSAGCVSRKNATGHAPCRNFTRTLLSTTMTKTIFALNMNTSYHVRVSAFGSAGYSLYTTVTVSTLPDVKLWAPVNLLYSPTLGWESSSVLLHWNVSSEVDIAANVAYNIFYCKEVQSDQLVLHVDCAFQNVRYKTSGKLSSLAAGQMYWAEVSAVCEDGHHGGSRTMFFRTAAEDSDASKPILGRVIKGQRSLSLFWGNPANLSLAGEPLYRVSACELYNRSVCRNADVLGNNFTVEYLQIDTKYTVEIALYDESRTTGTPLVEIIQTESYPRWTVLGVLSTYFVLLVATVCFASFRKLEVT